MKAYAALVRRAANVCGTPIAGLLVAKGDRARVLAQVGADDLGDEIPLACCDFLTAVLAADDTVVVEDALSDPRLASTPFVVGEPHARFFAGVPLRAADGVILGTLGVMDRTPRVISEQQILALLDLAAIAEDLLERERNEHTMRLLWRAMNEATDFVIITDFTAPSSGGPFIEYVNVPFLEATGYNADEIVGLPYSMLLAESNDPVVLEAIADNIEHERDSEKEVLIRRKDGSAFWVEYAGRPVRESGSGYSHWVAVGRDISMRRQTHEQMAALVQAIDAVDRHVEIYAMENGKYELAFQNAAVNSDTSEFVGTLLNDADIPGETPLRRQLKDGKNVVVTPDGLEIRPLDPQARTIMCIKQKAS